jgi:ribosomal protein S18 acetylase RimI-like enzyme
MNFKIALADYHDAAQAQDLIRLLDHYAQSPMGGGKPLAADVKPRLVRELAKIPNAFSVLAYVDNRAAGLMNCFQNFSTFKCKPLVNIHDVVVHEDFRRLGLATKMFHEVETIAVERGCCKLTLEVLTRNSIAIKAYTKFGFNPFELSTEHGQALFFEKVLY